MTLETISIGSCPMCGGPAQFIDPASATQLEINPTRTGLQPTDAGFVVRRVELPNVDEDLGDGWALRELHNHGLLNPPQRRWVARATNESLHDQAEAFGDGPSAAYLALRTALEARS